MTVFEIPIGLERLDNADWSDSEPVGQTLRAICNQILSAIDHANKGDSVVLCMRDVRFLGEDALGEILGLHCKGRRKNVRVSIQEASHQVAEKLQQTNLAPILCGSE